MSSPILPHPPAGPVRTLCQTPTMASTTTTSAAAPAANPDSLAQIGRQAARLWGQRALMWGAGTLGGNRLARLFLPAAQRNPYPLYEEFRRQAPLVRSNFGPRSMAVTASHAIAGGVLRSRAFAVGADSSPDFGIDLSLLDLNPPDHTRLRRLVMPAFSPRRIATLEAMVTNTVHRLLDRAEQAGSFDLVTALAEPLPVTVITELLGIPADDHRLFLDHGAAIAGALDGVQSVRHARRLHRAETELADIFTRLFVLRRQDPREDLVTDLVTAVDGGAQASPQELTALCQLLLVAGFETTVNLIGSTVLALHRSGQWALVVEDPSLAAAAVEETLRYDPPVQLTGRHAIADAEIEGHSIAAGTAVVALVGATGRDPEVFDRPDTFDLTRPHQGDHLAFSAGVHYCVGAPLARLEATIAVRELATRLPRLASTGRVRMRRSTSLRGPVAMPVRIV